MSRLVEHSLERLANTEIFLEDRPDPRSFEARQAVIIFSNFAGVANKFGNTAKYFHLVIPEEFKNDIENGRLGGLKAKIRSIGDEESGYIYFINVKVNMNVAYPPSVTLYVDSQGKKSHNSLDDATIGCLDRIDMERADCIINVKESKNNPGTAVFYLRKLNVVQIKNPEFGGAYEDWDEDPLDASPELLGDDTEQAPF